MAYYVYILASRKDGAIYVGMTNDIVRRVYEHRIKAVPGFTSKYNITRLVWFEIYDDATTAITREKELKKWKRSWKIQLIETQNPDWNDLYESNLQVGSSFRDSPQDQTRTLGIPGFARRRERPGLTARTYALAALSSRSAAARASAVISAPASIRAISSRR